MTIDKIEEDAKLALALGGRLDTITAPLLEEDNGHFTKTLFNKYAAPITLTLVASISCNVINIIMASNYFGASGLAVISICSPIMYLLYTLGALIGIGAATNATKFIGRDDYASVNALYSTSLALTVLVGIIVSLSGVICSKYIDVRSGISLCRVLTYPLILIRALRLSD